MTEGQSRQRRSGIRRPASGVGIDPQKLIHQRELRAWSRQDLAARVKMPNGKSMSRDALAKIENGERRPKPSTLRALCDALGCDPGDLLAGSPPPRDRADGTEFSPAAASPSRPGDLARRRGARECRAHSRCRIPGRD